MKLKLWPLLFSLFPMLACGTFARAAETSPTAAGYWEGEIAMPNRQLGIRVEILPRGDGVSFGGTIDIPLQGLRGFKLDPVIEGDTIAFALTGLPGDPRFKGKLAADGKSIAGDFSQGGGSTTFKLERKVKPKPQAEEETPAKGVPGKGLAGQWRAVLKPIPGVELRLSLELTQPASGKPEGVLVSLDQGNARIPITALTETDDAVDFETASINGAFKGKFNTDGSEIAGEWSQGGRATPLVFKRMPGAKGASAPP